MIEAILKMAFHIRDKHKWSGGTGRSRDWRIVTYKDSNRCGRLLNLGKISPRMHLCLGKLITEILWVQLTSLRSFVAVKKETWEWTRGARVQGDGVLLMRARMVNRPRAVVLLYASDGWVIGAAGEEPHQSPRPPTLSLGMMRSSEPCFKNTFPAQETRRHVKDHSLMEGFTAEHLQTAHHSPAWPDLTVQL